jgi:transcriptional regulator with PAS, ATPase and Fis domain
MLHNPIGNFKGPTPEQQLKRDFDDGKLNVSPMLPKIEEQYTSHELKRINSLLPADKQKFNSLANAGLKDSAIKFLEKAELHYMNTVNSQVGFRKNNLIGGPLVYQIDPDFKPIIQSQTDEALSQYITADAETIKMKDKVRHLVSMQDTVLITGPTGTGKELIAKALGTKVVGRINGMVSINCAGLPENLIESELFGHAKGSFTGAMMEKKGLFMHATCGTIFLDEFGELSLAMQAKLLRVLQERAIRKVGSNDSEPINTRVIVATNKDLQKEYREGRFREDLYWRVAIFTLKTKALKDRREDIPLIIDHLDSPKSVKPFAGKFPRNYEFTDEQLSGNVRAIDAYIKRYQIFGELDFN